MNRSTRMLLMNSGKRKVGFEYEWEPEDHYGPYMPTTYDDRPMEPQSAFYDRRGRRHYNNGRYAPMAAYGAPEAARRYPQYSDGRVAPRGEYRPMEPWSSDYSQTGGRDRRVRSDGPRMIGFGREWGDEDMRSDATMPQLVEMDRLRGQRSKAGMAYSDHLPAFDRQMAMEWTQGLENADGTKGPHWSMEQTTEAMKKHGVECDPVEWYAVMNSLYSDYCEALKKNNASTMETYVCLAKAWIKDEDAVPDKAAAYFTYIVDR